MNRKTIYLVVPHPEPQGSDTEDNILSLGDNVSNSSEAATTPGVPGHAPQAKNGINAEALQQQPLVQIRTMNNGSYTLSPLELKAGDMLQLDDHEWLDVKAGGIALILIRYKFEEFKD